MSTTSDTGTSSAGDAPAAGDAGGHRPGPHAAGGAALLGALGIVYGDIGTSPLYALRESFEGPGHVLAVTGENVLGVLSLIVWSLLIVITVKYLAFVMRADNHGEGGILVLTMLLPPRLRLTSRGRAVVMLGLFGTALLYGDGMITPAISVLAAMEGTAIAAPSVASLTVPLSIVILVLLFAVQRRGTGAVGRAFGPVMVVWFSVLGLLGVAQIVREPGVLAALNPVHGVMFFVHNGMAGFLALGSVFLVVTGGEALYADMGHFGRRPITQGWFALVLPGLVLNYLGQGALLLGNPEAIDNPFYRLAPSWASLPLVVLATAATVIASQALISGAFSLTMQAVQFGFMPRVRIVHTSAATRGQVYVPAVNWTLMVACVGLVVGFGSSTALASAYGVAVTMTMVITTALFYAILRSRWGWSGARAGALCGAFALVDLAFFGANLPKVPSGGWFPLVVGGAVFAVLTTWFTGRRIIRERAGRGRTPMDAFLASIATSVPRRVEGTAVHLFGIPGHVPPTLLNLLRTAHVLHEDVLVVTVVTAEVPHVPAARRVEVTDRGMGIREVHVHYGFLDRPRLRTDLHDHLGLQEEDTTWFLGRDVVVVTDAPGMVAWREHLFALLRRNATDAARYFDLPHDRVVELSAHVEL